METKQEIEQALLACRLQREEPKQLFQEKRRAAKRSKKQRRRSRAAGAATNKFCEHQKPMWDVGV
jgi:hypothetical protein